MKSLTAQSDDQLNVAGAGYSLESLTTHQRQLCIFIGLLKEHCILSAYKSDVSFLILKGTFGLGDFPKLWSLVWFKIRFNFRYNAPN
jgi:hypothetical protein